MKKKNKLVLHLMAIERSFNKEFADENRADIEELIKGGYLKFDRKDFDNHIEKEYYHLTDRARQYLKKSQEGVSESISGRF